MDDKLLALPWQIQLALGSGYAAYVIAYAGLRDGHKGADIAFRSLVFGLIASAVIYVLGKTPPWVYAPLAFIAATGSAALWRYAGMGLFSAWVRGKNITWSDDTPSAWAAITLYNNKHTVSQVGVLLKSGEWLYCSQTHRFRDDPFGPVVLGPNGDISLYVTEIEDKEGNVKVMAGVTDVDYGSLMTHVPASEIARTNLRFSTN